MKSLREEILDQSLHFGAAAVVVLLAEMVGQGWITGVGGAIIGLALGLTREVTEGGRWGSGSWRDIAFWTLGGLVGGLL